ncbi:MAG: hypothetical protein ACUVT8_11395 [Armatimonadota bacterium]
MEYEETPLVEVLEVPKEQTSQVAAKAADVLDVVIELLEDIQKILSSGIPKKLRIRFGNKLLVELPVTLSASIAIAAGLASVIITKLAIDVERET